METVLYTLLRPWDVENWSKSFWNHHCLKPNWQTSKTKLHLTLRNVKIIKKSLPWFVILHQSTTKIPKQRQKQKSTWQLTVVNPRIALKRSRKNPSITLVVLSPSGHPTVAIITRTWQSFPNLKWTLCQMSLWRLASNISWIWREISKRGLLDMVPHATVHLSSIGRVLVKRNRITLFHATFL